MSKQRKRYYFAYGSNLHVKQMCRRCPGAKPIGQCRLPNFELVFRGVADIVPSPGAEVLGAIYTITARDEVALDRYEGFMKEDPLLGMYRKEVFLARVGGEVVEIMYYVMNAGRLSRPSVGYLDRIIEGYENWGFSTNSLLVAAGVLKAVDVLD